MGRGARNFARNRRAVWPEERVMAFKITIIGAGSVGFTKKLCSDILKVPEFEGIE